MTSSIKVICGVCESQHRTTNADFWCPECDEGLCSQCLKYHNALKATRLHEVIPVENYKQLPTSIANISHHCSEQLEELLAKLAKNTEKVNAMENNVSAIKDYASDLQAFLGSKMIETEIQKYETFLQSLFDDGSLRVIDINCKIEDKITDVLSTVTSLGVISIESSSPIVVMETGKEIQAQTIIDKPPARDDREGWRRRGTPSKDERPPPASDDRGPPPGRDKRVPPGDAWRNRRDDRGPPPSGESAWGRDRGRGDRGPPGDAWGRDRNRDDRGPPAESWRDKSRDTGAPPGASWGDRATARDSKRARPRKFDRGPSRGSRFASRDIREERGSPSRDYREDRGPSRDDKEEIDPWRRGGDSDRFGGGSDSLRDDRWESRKGGGGTPSEGGPPKTSWRDKQPENENEETW